jgi:hypothetical protein
VVQPFERLTVLGVDPKITLHDRLHEAAQRAAIASRNHMDRASHEYHANDIALY